MDGGIHKVLHMLQIAFVDRRKFFVFFIGCLTVMLHIITGRFKEFQLPVYLLRMVRHSVLKVICVPFKVPFAASGLGEILDLMGPHQ